MIGIWCVSVIILILIGAISSKRIYEMIDPELESSTAIKDIILALIADAWF